MPDAAATTTSTDSGSLLADRKSFSILIRQHHRELLVYARALTGEPQAAQDVVQEAFVAAYRKIDSFDVTRDFGAWMRGFVRNKYREWQRREKRAPVSAGDIEDMDRAVAAWQEARISASGNPGTVFEALENCLQRLPEKLKAAVDLFYLGETAGTAAAGKLGISEPSLRKRLERAREQLRLCISRKINASLSRTPV